MKYADIYKYLDDNEVKSAIDFGAKGDGVTDDTTALQTAIDSKASGLILNGQCKTYLTGQLNLHSDMEMRDFYLKVTDYSGDSSHSAINIGNIGSNADGVLRKNIRLFNIHVLGNRAGQDNLGEFDEDGGRHGFRFKGQVHNLVVENCSASGCASDGMCFSRGGYGSDLNPRFKNVEVKNCEFTYNRRLGLSLDNASQVRFSNCSFNLNGLDVGSSPGESGTSPRSGVDVEGYNTRSLLDNLVFENCQMLDNYQKAVIFYDPTDMESSGFAQRKNISLINCYMDDGQYGGYGDYTLSFSSSTGNKAKLPRMYKNVALDGCNIYSSSDASGPIELRSCENVMISNCVIEVGDSGRIGILDNVDNVYISNTRTGGRAWYSANKSGGKEAWVGHSLDVRYKALEANGGDDTLNLYLPRTSTTTNILLYSTETYLSGDFSALIFLNGSSGPVIMSESYAGLVGNPGTIIDIIDDEGNWQLQNVSSGTLNLQVFIYPEPYHN